MMIKFGLSALVAAGMLVSGLSAGSASAADLGGNCCADLEERIAELEATTARKGNRKVSLTISGWVAEQVLWWDDGVESNTYVQGIGTTLASHFKMTGRAQITPGWSAGYVIHVEVYGSENLLTTNQTQYTGPSLYDVDANGAFNFNGVHTVQSYWFIQSDHLGKIGVGLQSQASDNTAILPDGSGTLVPANFVAFDWGGFGIRGADGAVANGWFGLAGCTDCNGIPVNNVRYDSPTWNGFSMSASWGDDDFWDVALRYAGEFGGFKVAAAGAYSETSNVQTITAGGIIAQAPDTEFFQIGAYVQHIKTGLWLYGAYGTIETNNNLVNGQAGFVDNDFWYIKGGLRRRMHPFGHTIFYVEYEDFQNNALFLGPINSGGGGSTCSEFFAECKADVMLWGVGIVQEIDAAAMSMWLTYRHIEADINDVRGANTGSVPVEDFQYVKFGALINF